MHFSFPAVTCMCDCVIEWKIPASILRAAHCDEHCLRSIAQKTSSEQKICRMWMYNIISSLKSVALSLKSLAVCSIDPRGFPPQAIGGLMLLIAEKLAQIRWEISAGGEIKLLRNAPSRQRERWCAAFPFRRDATYIITFWTNKVECISHPTGIIHTARYASIVCVCVCMKTRFFHCAVVGELYLLRSAPRSRGCNPWHLCCLGK